MLDVLYDYKVVSNSPIGVTAKVEPYRAQDGTLPPLEHRQYYIDLDIQNVSANTILIH